MVWGTSHIAAPCVRIHRQIHTNIKYIRNIIYIYIYMYTHTYAVTPPPTKNKTKQTPCYFLHKRDLFADVQCPLGLHIAGNPVIDSVFVICIQNSTPWALVFFAPKPFCYDFR